MKYLRFIEDSISKYTHEIEINFNIEIGNWESYYIKQYRSNGGYLEHLIHTNGKTIINPDNSKFTCSEDEINSYYFTII